ncbi:unnamed protein product [Parnassius apollo]|uniref:(apollo) hypothetical protein n=1 Tax=Parnassius apollo TaxID=110799 RepID=A0A8S3XSV0_PARAO|nr:unnamed protein product [Parnassius apollo]
MSKIRRASSVASRGADGDDSDDGIELSNPGPPPSRKKKKPNDRYNSVEEMIYDFCLMFSNCRQFNKEGSMIYEDANLLKRVMNEKLKVCLQTKQLLRDDDAVPDVAAAVQELLLNLFTTVYNHQDEEGRCYSGSMAELPQHDEATNGEKVRAISLDLVKRRSDKGLYKRLDHFQQDMFAVFKRARRLSRTDSQIFEDSVELQSYFIEQQDQLCRGENENEDETRYIDGLHSEQKYITPWEKSLTPIPSNPDPAQLNAHKLSQWMTEDDVNGYLAHDKNLTEADIQKMDQNTKIVKVKALCVLRDYMMRDAFAIYKNL